MKFNVVAILATLGLAAAQGVTDKITPSSPAPAGCSGDWNGQFELTVVNAQHAKRDVAIAPRGTCGGDGTLVLSLAAGVLTDAKARTGYVASNYQFQFDGPPQAGAIYTAGFSVCGNGSVALGGSAVFYECSSGDFFNLYDRSWAAQCSPVELAAIPCGAGSGNVGQNGDGQASAGQGGDGQVVAGQGGDGQVVGTQVVQTTIISALSDGQPQVITTAVPVAICQITDGQAQVHTTPCASVTKAPAATTAVPVSQYSDGQIQVTPVGSAPAGPAAPATNTGAAAAPTTSAPASGGSGGGSGGSGGSSGGNATLSTKASPKPSGTGAAASASSSLPASNGAGRLEMASVSALVIGIVGALFFL